ncbi:hypothetical protein [Salmon gill poxvirus]|nr:hypothetical protein [Salmon gill poxvirus]
MADLLNDISVQMGVDVLKKILFDMLKRCSSKKGESGGTLIQKELSQWDTSKKAMLVCASKNAIVCNKNISNRLLKPINYMTGFNHVYWKLQEERGRMIHYWKFTGKTVLDIPDHMFGSLTEIWIHAVDEDELLLWLYHFNSIFIKSCGTLIIQMNVPSGSNCKKILTDFFTKIGTAKEWLFYFLTDPYEYGISFVPKIT